MGPEDWDELKELRAQRGRLIAELSQKDEEIKALRGKLVQRQLARDVLVALYASGKCEPEDARHNAIVALRAADALIEALAEEVSEESEAERSPYTRFKMFHRIFQPNLFSHGPAGGACGITT